MKQDEKRYGKEQSELAPKKVKTVSMAEKVMAINSIPKNTGQ